MLASPFYDEVPSDMGGNEVWVKAQAAGVDGADPEPRGPTLLQRIASMLRDGPKAAAPARTRLQGP